MLSTSVLGRPTAVALLFFGVIGTADAGDPAWLAINAGILLGNAYRCGVSIERVARAERVIHRFVVAAGHGSTDEATADALFAESFEAGAYPSGDLLIPACDVAVAQFERLERHHQQAGLN
jgi:hypothetical protein